MSAVTGDVRAPRIARVAHGTGRVLQHVRRGPACALTAAWALLIWYVSSIPAPAMGEWNAFGGVVTNFAHAPEFGMLTLLVCLCLPRVDGWALTETRVQRYVWLAVVLYAIVDELHQGTTSHRDPSVCDVLTDSTASACVLLTVRYAGGAHANATKLVRTLAWGIVACFACATIATFVPRLWPRHEWL